MENVEAVTVTNAKQSSSSDGSANQHGAALDAYRREATQSAIKMALQSAANDLRSCEARLAGRDEARAAGQIEVAFEVRALRRLREQMRSPDFVGVTVLNDDSVWVTEDGFKNLTVAGFRLRQRDVTQVEIRRGALQWEFTL